MWKFFIIFFSIKTQNKNYIITSSISKENSFNKSIFLLLQLSTLPNQFHRKMQIKNKKQQQKKQKSIQLQSINSQQQKQKIFFDRMTALTDFFYWIFSYLKIVFFLSVLCSNMIFNTYFLVEHKSKCQSNIVWFHKKTTIITTIVS